MTLDEMNTRFRVIEDEWKIGSPSEQAEYLAELTAMRTELDGVTGAQASGALWLKRTIDRVIRNITAEQARV
ncbi:hypothetical protein SAMN04515671_2820 [Nakamurella panacisegetis]|uniref:Uncharacterized protein n=2 Tax=Nakamurella panacisegetis TaxID=1090615 RepID=A0A1H0PKK8_9ACTN|nr:hypothetical protein SAMN04515671_2820 [Nakamurella panacisegetis]